MTTTSITLFTAAVFVSASAFDISSFSPCLQRCLKPLTKFESTYTYQFKHFEKVCDTLEEGAYCSWKCDQADQRAFHHFTTFYRLHCVDFAEELEPHMECLTEHAPETDKKCRSNCSPKLNKLVDKAEEAKAKCKAMECSTVCYYQEFSGLCPETHDILMRLNMRQINDVVSSATPETLRSLHPDCLRLNDMEYMRAKLNGEDTL